jgi:hypothetical protein
MQYISELIGGVLLLVIVFLGMKHAYQLLETRENDHEHVQPKESDGGPTDPAKGPGPGADV